MRDSELRDGRDLRAPLLCDRDCLSDPHWKRIKFVSVEGARGIQIVTGSGERHVLKCGDSCL